MCQQEQSPFKSHQTINAFIGLDIAKGVTGFDQKCHYLHNYRCEVDRKELRGLVSQIVSVSVIVSGASLEFKRGVIGGGLPPATPPTMVCTSQYVSMVCTAQYVSIVCTAQYVSMVCTAATTLQPPLTSPRHQVQP